KVASLAAVPNAGSVRQGTLPLLRLGAFEVPGVPGVLGGPVQEMEKGLDIELDGLLGSGLLAAFRVTLVDRGKTMWLEDMPRESVPASVPLDQLDQGSAPLPTEPTGSAPTVAPTGSAPTVDPAGSAPTVTPGSPVSPAEPAPPPAK